MCRLFQWTGRGLEFDRLVSSLDVFTAFGLHLHVSHASWCGAATLCWQHTCVRRTSAQFCSHRRHWKNHIRQMCASADGRNGKHADRRFCTWRRSSRVAGRLTLHHIPCFTSGGGCVGGGVCTKSWKSGGAFASAACTSERFKNASLSWQ